MDAVLLNFLLNFSILYLIPCQWLILATFLILWLLLTILWWVLINDFLDYNRLIIYNLPNISTCTLRHVSSFLFPSFLLLLTLHLQEQSTYFQWTYRSFKPIMIYLGYTYKVYKYRTVKNLDFEDRSLIGRTPLFLESVTNCYSVTETLRPSFLDVLLCVLYTPTLYTSDE